MNILSPETTALQLIYNMKRQYPTSYLEMSKKRCDSILEVCDPLERDFWREVKLFVEKSK